MDVWPFLNFVMVLSSVGYASSFVTLPSSEIFKYRPNFEKTFDAVFSFNLFAKVRAQDLRNNDTIGHRSDRWLMKL